MSEQNNGTAAAYIAEQTKALQKFALAEGWETLAAIFAMAVAEAAKLQSGANSESDTKH